jgi:5-formyltetrahydrofolate cyclo-ligase
LPTAPDPIALRKTELRREMLARREALPPAERAAAAQAIAARGMPVTLNADMIVSGYSPLKSEISPIPLLRRCADAGAALALPVVQGRGQPLAMRAWSFGDELAAGVWGIREPKPDALEIFPDIVIVPLLAFDRAGYRLGYGAGYYDLTLARLRAMKPVIAVGIAFATQEIAEVPKTSFDQRLDFVLTEREIIEVKA